MRLVDRPFCVPHDEGVEEEKMAEGRTSKVGSWSRRLLFALATNERFERGIRTISGGESAAYTRARRYVAGRTREDAFVVARRLAGEGMATSIDFFGESVFDSVEADRVAESYVELASALSEAPEDTFLSLDLSHLGIDQSGDGARRRLERIAEALPPDRYVQVGAEEARRTDQILATVLAVAKTGGRVAATVQANLRRSHADAQALAEAKVPIRLVKGAYVEAPDLVYSWGKATDQAFRELARELHEAGAELSLGTHDAALRDSLLRDLRGTRVEMLLGVLPGDARSLVSRGVPVRVYVPYGQGWFRYAMRRWAESRGA